MHDNVQLTIIQLYTFSIITILVFEFVVFDIFMDCEWYCIHNTDYISTCNIIIFQMDLRHIMNHNIITPERGVKP
jgi:hypothetical protein